MAVAEVFGDYRVLDVLGHGAMGMVYRAHDPRLDRFVALKIVHPGRVASDTTKARARLVSEARALARVSHPNVLAVYDVGVHEGLVFVALELIDGIDLAQWLRSRSRRWTDVVPAFIEAASGLTAVHEVGLVHRDVKPANILVEHAPRGRALGRVLVADFGIARATEALPELTLPTDVASSRSSDDAPLTEAGRVVGTPAYMAPEQHLGLDVGPAADQYALCVALYEALYGRRPYTGDAQTMLLAKTRPRKQPPKSDVPVWLWTIVRRGLSPHPHDRFPAMSDLLAALQRGRPRRRWLVAGLVGAAIAVPAIVLSLVREQPCRGVRAQVAEVWNEDRRRSIETAFAASERPGAVQAWTRVAERFDTHAQELAAMYGEACEATRVRHEQSEGLFDRRIACLDHRKQEFAQTLALLAAGDADIVDHADDVASSLDPIAACGDVSALEAGIPPPSPALREPVANVRRMLADAEGLNAAGRTDDAASTADAAVELARTIDYAPTVVEALTVAGEFRERQSRIDEASEALEEAVSTGLQIGHDGYVARALVLRTWIAGEYERDIEAAERWGALGRSQLERYGVRPELRLALHNALGTAYSTAGRYDDALREYEQALARAEADPELAVWTATLHANIGSLLYRLGDLERARASYERALEIFRALVGNDHAWVANTEIRLGQILEASGRHEQAIETLRRAIASLERTQATPTELATALIALGIALRSAGADEESNTTYRRAVDLLTPTGDDVSLAHALVNYGYSCIHQEIYDAAETQFERAIELLEPLDARSPDLGNAWIGLGQIREFQSRPDEAHSLYRRALDAAPDTRIGARALVAIALLHHAAERYDEAVTALDRQDAILAAAPVVGPDDHLGAAVARMKVMLDAGRAQEATAQIEALDRLLAEARARGVSPVVEEGALLLERARAARDAQ